MGKRQVAAGTFQALRGAGRGYVLRSVVPRYFRYDSGASCFPIGENLQEPWAGGSYDYDRWVGQLADHGAGFFRFFVGILCNRENRLTLEHLPDRPGDGNGLGRYDLAGAWRIDHIMEFSEARAACSGRCASTRSTRCSSRTSTSFASWHTNPYNAANGGPAATPADCFRNEEAKRLYRQRLRYTVARWGYSPSLFVWEFWNEWDQTTGYDSAVDGRVAPRDGWLRAGDRSLAAPRHHELRQHCR